MTAAYIYKWRWENWERPFHAPESAHILLNITNDGHCHNRQITGELFQWTTHSNAKSFLVYTLQWSVDTQLPNIAQPDKEGFMLNFSCTLTEAACEVSTNLFFLNELCFLCVSYTGVLPSPLEVFLCSFPQRGSGIPAALTAMPTTEVQTSVIFLGVLTFGFCGRDRTCYHTWLFLLGIPVF